MRGEAFGRVAGAGGQVEVRGPLGAFGAHGKGESAAVGGERGIGFVERPRGQGDEADRGGRIAGRGRARGERVDDGAESECEGEGGEGELGEAWRRDGRGGGRRENRRFRARRRVRIGWRVERANRRDQPVAALADGFHVGRVGGVITEGAAQLANRPVQDIVGDEDIGPDARHQRIAGHDFAGGLGEALEHLHHLGLEAHLFGAARHPVQRWRNLPLAGNKCIHGSSIDAGYLGSDPQIH